MATSNELLRDALVRRQIYLQRFSTGLSNDIIKVLDGTEDALRAALERRLATILKGGVDFGPETTARLKVLAEIVARIRAAGFDQATDMWNDNLAEVAKAEAAFINSAVKEHSPVVLDTVVPTATQLASIVRSKPFEGRLMKEWASGLADADADRIMDAVKIGMTQGQTTNDIVRRVVGSSQFDGADGVMEIARRDATSITRTATNFIANEARQAFSQANDDIFSEEVYVATLDSRTTEECAALDGKVFKIGEGPIPPIHWNCRSTRVPALDGKLIGKRPASGATEADLEGLNQKDRRAMVEKLTGQVPAATTYQDFLAKQTVAFQEDVLGKGKAALFRKGGLSLDRFVNRNNEPYTLAQLQKLEPAAFKRAGLSAD